MDNDVILPVLCEDRAKDACEGAVKIVQLKKEGDYAIIGLCMSHAKQRGYLDVPQVLNNEAAMAYLAAHPTCEDVGQKQNPYGSNPDGKPECTFSLNPLRWRQATKEELYVFYLPKKDTHVALCKTHAARRAYWDHPRMWPEGEGAEAYAAYQRKMRADKDFVQIYHPELICTEDGDSCVKDKVAEYYFSDGSTLPICTVHLPGTHALRSSKNGHWMSREYYDQVYSKKE